MTLDPRKPQAQTRPTAVLVLTLRWRLNEQDFSFTYCDAVTPRAVRMMPQVPKPGSELAERPDPLGRHSPLRSQTQTFFYTQSLAVACSSQYTTLYPFCTSTVGEDTPTEKKTRHGGWATVQGQGLTFKANLRSIFSMPYGPPDLTTNNPSTAGCDPLKTTTKSTAETTVYHTLVLGTLGSIP